ncbi:MAG: hypothetical protein KC910_18160 [Candidatus Eremiobacteraeota bacterium]|nr:hypothetical protein [Candidatus Eremiobacteraeota bacterium]
MRIDIFTRAIEEAQQQGQPGYLVEATCDSLRSALQAEKPRAAALSSLIHLHARVEDTLEGLQQLQVPAPSQPWHERLLEAFCWYETGLIGLYSYLAEEEDVSPHDAFEVLRAADEAVVAYREVAANKLSEPVETLL